MELICIRHGRTAWNVLRRFQGQTDIPLDEEGLTQAQALATHLRDERFDLAVASDLMRARVTAEVILGGRGLPLELSAQLREMHFGLWEGLTWDEIVARWPELDAKNEKAPMYYTAEGGESWDDLCSRVDAFLRKTAARMGAEERALIVSHAGVMHAIVRSLVSVSATGGNPDALGIRFSPGGIIRARGSFSEGVGIPGHQRNRARRRDRTNGIMVDSAGRRSAIAATDPAVAQAARARIDQLTKPRGSLGRMETLAVQLCAIAGGLPEHNFERRAILVGAGDHGVATAGVSAYPPEVTAQMVASFLGGTAAIGAFARAVRAEVYVANFGVRVALTPHDRLIDVSAGLGTANLAQRPAIARDALEGVLDAGERAFRELRARAPFDVLALGDMGIGNSTSATAVIAAFTGEPARAVAGRGTGVDDAGLERKIAAIEAGLERCSEFGWDEIASEVGGFEIVGLAGVMLAAAGARIPIVLDGFIVGAAALIAADIAPSVLDYCIAAHRSHEPGHAIALGALKLDPLLDLELRLGEASGAALALPLIEAAARMVREMQTFAEAGVSTDE